MSAIVVACPHCQKELKLRDRSKLGQKAKCPSCSKPFELRAPTSTDEVRMELVESEPSVGVGAQWVPDNVPVQPGGRTAADAFPHLQASVATGEAGGASIATGTGSDGLQRLMELRRKNAKRRNMAILFGGVTALIIAGAVWAVSSFGPVDPAVDVAANPSTHASPATGTPLATTTAVPPAGAAIQATPAVYIPTVSVGANLDRPLLPHQELTRTQLRDNGTLVNNLAPRRGDAIRLLMLPSGINVLFHLRPAQLWSDDPVWTEFRYSLTEDVTNWIAGQLKQICRREPQQIEECVIGMRLGATGSAPDIATVVYFAEEARLSDLIEEFSGEPLSDGGGPRINSAPPYAYLIKDTKTIAIAPEAAKYELPEVINTPNPNASEGVYRLLDLTDRQRVFTVLFEVDDVKRHEEWLFSDRTLPVYRQFLDWFGDDVETVGWSVDLQGESMVSEVLLRNRSVASSSRLVGDTLSRLELLPQDLQAACLRMHPTTKGFQALIGRFPAMIEAYREATIPTTDTRHVKLTTVLPRKAAPNLALGTLLTWDLSTQTDFSTVAPPTSVAAATPQVTIPDKVEDRLKQLKFDGEFMDIPLQDCLAYIASETQTEIDIDGNALKDAGFTKNIKIKLNLGKVSGLEAIKQIVLFERCRPPVPEKQMCISIDEAAKTVLFSTEFFVKEQGKTVYPLVTE
ncbi:MAG: hypothetical protein ACK5Q5_11685 [Planctomycetaceae bacterium]